MLMAHTIGLRERTESNQLLSDPVSELEDEEAEVSEKILYKATFDELEGDQLKYDTVMWVLISIMLVLAWGFGIVMLLYLPIRRYILRKDICSRRLYVTPHEVVYKVTRPSFLPFLGFTEIDRRIPLHLVIDVIIEQDEWWRNFGIDDLELQTLAIRILSQTCSSSGCERNWSVFERIHTKRRNRLEHKRLNDLVYTHYNLRLKERQASRKFLTDPISLENIDLTDDWVVEAEDDDAPLLDVDEIDDWMDVADAILDEGEGGAAAGCLQSIYGIHTFRVENIAYGKAASVDELQVQGVCNPGLLRKVIMTEAAKCMEEFGRIWKPTIYSGEGENLPGHTRSLIEVPAIARSPASSWKVVASPRHFLAETGGILHTDLVLHKLEEIEHSVKSLEALVGSQA